jgi:hypothetical protein
MLLDIIGFATAVLLIWIGVRVMRHPDAFRSRFKELYSDKSVERALRYLPPVLIAYGVLVIGLWLFARFRG